MIFTGMLMFVLVDIALIVACQPGSFFMEIFAGWVGEEHSKAKKNPMHLPVLIRDKTWLKLMIG